MNGLCRITNGCQFQATWKSTCSELARRNRSAEVHPMTGCSPDHGACSSSAKPEMVGWCEIQVGLFALFAGAAGVPPKSMAKASVSVASDRLSDQQNDCQTVSGGRPIDRRHCAHRWSGSRCCAVHRAAQPICYCRCRNFTPEYGGCAAQQQPTEG